MPERFARRGHAGGGFARKERGRVQRDRTGRVRQRVETLSDGITRELKLTFPTTSPSRVWIYYGRRHNSAWYRFDLTPEKKNRASASDPSFSPPDDPVTSATSDRTTPLDVEDFAHRGSRNAPSAARVLVWVLLPRHTGRESDLS